MAEPVVIADCVELCSRVGVAVALVSKEVGVRVAEELEELEELEHPYWQPRLGRQLSEWKRPSMTRSKLFIGSHVSSSVQFIVGSTYYV